MEPKYVIMHATANMEPNVRNPTRTSMHITLPRDNDKWWWQHGQRHRDLTRVGKRKKNEKHIKKEAFEQPNKTKE